MKITYKLYSQLISDLASVAISAGETDATNAMQYARNTYYSILDEWEEKTGEVWEFED